MNSDEPISEADYKWRVSRTDGVAVSSYAFDDFGRNIDPRTGKFGGKKKTLSKILLNAGSSAILGFGFDIGTTLLQSSNIIKMGL